MSREDAMLQFLEIWSSHSAETKFQDAVRASVSVPFSRRRALLLFGFMTTKRAYKLQEFVAHTSSVNCLKIGRKSSRVLVSGGEDHKVNLWAIGKTQRQFGSIGSY